MEDAPNPVVPDKIVTGLSNQDEKKTIYHQRRRRHGLTDLETPFLV